MNEIDIRRYAELMKELELTGLEITEDNRVVRLERNVTTSAEPMIAVSPSALGLHAVGGAGGAAGAAGGSSAGNPSAGNGTAQGAADYISVKSPIVGVFYAAPAENASPFVSLGDRVERGKTLCIIEAMKLMNEICAEEGGTIAEICVTNGQVVEYGTELFRIRR